jgi:hypothetical protein
VVSELQPETRQIAVHKAVSWPNHLARQWQYYCLNTNTRTGCWRRNTRTTKTEMSLFLDQKFLFFILLYIFSIFLNHFFLFSLFFSPLMRQWQSYYSNANISTGYWRSNTRTIKTETSSHLILDSFLLFLSSFFFFLFHLNACLVHYWLVHYLSLLISLFLFFFLFFLFFLFSSYSSILHFITFAITS